MSDLNPKRTDWYSLEEALTIFVHGGESTQSQWHIKPLHWYVACRLVLEGGFLPEEIVPRPPFEVDGDRLVYLPAVAKKGERTVLGGLKTKAVDVVVAKDGIGPCIAVSLKGTLKALRNLTNRMEEAAGDCTNLHLAYPALVYAFWHVIRGNREGDQLQGPAGATAQPNDVAIGPDGRPNRYVGRYEFAMAGLAGRGGLREEPSKYEAIALTLVSADRTQPAAVIAGFPEAEDILPIPRFFEAIYREYDLRFVYQAPDLEHVTRRREWAKDSPAFDEIRNADFDFRMTR